MNRLPELNDNTFVWVHPMCRDLVACFDGELYFGMDCSTEYDYSPVGSREDAIQWCRMRWIERN